MKNIYIYIRLAVLSDERWEFGRGNGSLKGLKTKMKNKKIYIRLAVFGYELLEFGDAVNEGDDVRELAQDHQRPAVVVCVCV